MDLLSKAAAYAEVSADLLKRARPASSSPSKHELALRSAAEYAAGLDKEEKKHEKRVRFAEEEEGAFKPADRELYLEFDGASRANPGPAGAGWCAYVPGQEAIPVLAGYAYVSDKDTNNTAEYTALQRGLDAVLALMEDPAHSRRAKITKVTIRGDSTLVVKQVTGEWKCNFPHLCALRDEVKRTLGKLRYAGVKCSLAFIPRAENKVADLLSNYAVDRKDEAAHVFPAGTMQRGMTTAAVKAAFPQYA